MPMERETLEMDTEIRAVLDARPSSKFRERKAASKMTTEDLIEKLGEVAAFLRREQRGRAALWLDEAAKRLQPQTSE